MKAARRGEERRMTVGLRHDDLRKRNRAMVIAAVRRSGQPSRTEIAGATGLSHSTISAIAADLIEEGILTETKSGEVVAARRGRPQIALGLSPRAGAIIAVVLSLNSLAAALIDYSGAVIDEEHRRLATRTLPKDMLITETVAMIGRLIDRQPRGTRVMRISFAVQGITDLATGSILWSPITSHTDIPFGPALEEAFGIPVTVENDCNMIAVALKGRAPERYRDNFITILLSNGIGMGLFLKGELFTGTKSSGGEFGHMIYRPGGALCRCGRRGCIEAYAGNYAIWRNAHGIDDQEEPGPDIGEAEMRALAEAARRRDGAERAAYAIAGEAIGTGLGSVFALIDPAPVAIVGMGAAAFDLIEKPMRRAIAGTAGGQLDADISVDIEPNELPLMLEGCATRALTFIDQEIFAAGEMRGAGKMRRAG
jgi:predicted NBD/HSP70 family sugar kinase